MRIIFQLENEEDKEEMRGFFRNIIHKTSTVEASGSGSDEQPKETSLDDLEMSARMRNALSKNGITTILQVLEAGRSKILKFKAVGKNSLVELENELKKIGAILPN